MLRRKTKRAEPPIIDPLTHPRSNVCLRVAADFLGLDERTVKVRIELGQLKAYVDGKVYRIELTELIRYESERRLVS